jgi:predicted PurR-regulated permease PerM
MTTIPKASDDPLFMKKAIEATIRIGLVVVLVVWCYRIVEPFIFTIIWGIVIAIGTYPAYQWLQARMGGRRGLAAAVFTLLLLALLIVPTVMLTGALLDSARELSADLADGDLTIPAPPEGVARWPFIGERLHEFWSLAAENLDAALGQIEPQLKSFGTWLLKAGAKAGLGILQFVFAIIIAGVLVARASGGYRLTSNIAGRLLGERGMALADLAHHTVQSVVNGIVGIALIQAILAGLGFLAIGLPGAGIWALVCLVLAVVQIDILLILIPIAIYVFSVAGTGVAVAYLIWSIFVGVLNNALKPLLLGRGLEIPILIILIGAIGGMLLSGIIGLFVGSVVLALGYTLFIAWLREDSERSAQDAADAASG